MPSVNTHSPKSTVSYDAMPAWAKLLYHKKYVDYEVIYYANNYTSFKEFVDALESFGFVIDNVDEIKLPFRQKNNNLVDAVVIPRIDGYEVRAFARVCFDVTL